MPYEIRKVKGGFKVAHKGQSKTYSKKPQSKAKAAAQMRAMYANTPKSHMMEAKQHFLEGLLAARKETVRESAFEHLTPTIKAPTRLVALKKRNIFDLTPRLTNSPRFQRESGGRLFANETPVGRKFFGTLFNRAKRGQ